MSNKGVGVGTGGLGKTSGYTVPKPLMSALVRFGAGAQGMAMATVGAVKNADPKEALRIFGASANTGMAIVGNRLRQDAIGARAQGAGIGADLGWDKSAQDLYKGGHQAYGQRMSGYADFEAASAAFDGKNTSIASNAGMRAVYGENPGGAAPGQKPSDLMGAAMSGQLGSDMRNSARYPGSSFFTNVGSAMARGKRTMGGSALLSSRNWEQNTAGHDFGFGLAEGFRSVGNIGQFLGDAGSGISASNAGTGPGSSGRASEAEVGDINEFLNGINVDEKPSSKPADSASRSK